MLLGLQELEPSNPQFSWQPEEPVPVSAYIGMALDPNANVDPVANLDTLTSAPGLYAWTAAQPYIPASEAQTILNAGVEFGERIQRGTLKRSTAQIPSVQEAVQELEELGVPAGYFTADVVTNLQTALDDLQVDEGGRLSPKAGGWSCWCCRVEFAVLICLLVVAIAVTIMLCTGGAGALAAALLPVLQGCAVAAIQANAAVLAGVLAGMTWVGGSGVIIAALSATLPNLICQKIGSCD